MAKGDMIWCKMVQNAVLFLDYAKQKKSIIYSSQIWYITIQHSVPIHCVLIIHWVHWEVIEDLNTLQSLGFVPNEWRYCLENGYRCSHTHGFRWKFLNARILKTQTQLSSIYVVFFCLGELWTVESQQEGVWCLWSAHWHTEEHCPGFSTDV